MANKDTAKQWFETNDFPTEAQFAQVFEWLRWKDEKIAFADLSPELQALIIATDNRIEFADTDPREWNFPGHTLIDRIMVITTADTTFSMGITVSGTEIFDNVPVQLANRQTGLMSNPYYCVSPTTIYWSVLPANSKLIVFIK